MAGDAAGATRYLYLARHGQALPDESGLTETGRQQAVLLGERLREVPISAVHHGPLARAAQTASLIAGQLDGGAPLRVSEVAGDYVPYLPDKDELPEESAGHLLRFLEWVTDQDREEGAALAARALERFTGTVEGDGGGAGERHELVVTHNFLVGWLVRAALDAPKWRWLGLNHGNAALTVIRYAPGRLPALLTWNDSEHLPAGLRTL